VRVLIVDDSPVIRSIIEGALRHADPDLAKPLHAASGIDALAELDRCSDEHLSLDLILCDLHMPRMSGLDFLREMKRRNLAPGVPVVMVTADDTDLDIVQAISAGAQGYLTKPFTQNQIQICVASQRLAASTPSGTKGILGNDR